MPSNHFIFCHPLLPPSTFPSIRVFSNKSVLWIRWSKYWSFSFSISPSNEYSGLISIRIHWLDEVTWGPVKEMQTLHIPWSSSATLPLNHYKTLHQISHGWGDTAFKGVSPLCPPLSGKATTLFNVIQNSFLWDLIQHRGQVFSIKSSFMYASGKSTLKRGGMIFFTPFFFSLARRYRFWDSFEDGRATRQKDGSSRTSTAFKPCLLYFQHNIHERENTTNYHLTELSILFRFLCFMLNGFTVNTGLSMRKLGSASNNNNRNIIHGTGLEVEQHVV